ncbi:MAG: DUF547 domain-containing protein [Pseudomonadales bacterium]
MRSLLIGSLLVIVFAAGSPGVGAVEPDWQGYRQLLSEYVEPGVKDAIPLNLVNYQGLGSDPRFAALVSMVRNFDVGRLERREEKLAFYINAYNLLTIQLILDEWPVDSIRDIGNFLRGPWDRVMLQNADGNLTLDDIEHRVLRPLGEPRIHVAVNCASISCPDLRDEPYEAAKLDWQLDDQARKFLSQSGKGLSVEGDLARVSAIFGWYGEDFGGRPGVEVFLRKYAEPIDFKRIKTDLKYNWRLNNN